MTTIAILAALIISIILHEICHALVLFIIGAPINSFQIGIPVVYRHGLFSLGLIPVFGGVQADINELSLIKQVWFFAAGPVGSALIGIVIVWLGIRIDSYSLKLLGLVSLAIGIFNLIPVPPMDGYQIVIVGRQVPYSLQVFWAVAGWALIAAATFWWKH